MPNPEDIAARLEAAGIDDFTINLEHGIVYVFFKGQLERNKSALAQNQDERWGMPCAEK